MLCHGNGRKVCVVFLMFGRKWDEIFSYVYWDKFVI